MDLASGKIELSERYIQKLRCGHTLQSYNAVVLWRNNGIGTPSVTAASMCDLYLERLWQRIMANVRSIVRLIQKRIDKIQFPGLFKLNHTYFRQRYILRAFYLDFSVKVPNPA